MRVAVMTLNAVFSWNTALSSNPEYARTAFTIESELYTNAFELITFCEYASIDTLWIMPDTRVSLLAETAPHLFQVVEGYEISIARRAKGVVMGFKVWGIGKKTRRVVFLKHAYRWGLTQETDAEKVLLALVALHHALGIPVELSAGRTGRALMQKLCKPEWIKPIDVSMLPEIHATPLHEKKMLTDEELTKKYLHIFDKTAQFLRGCIGCELGVGSAGCTVSGEKYFSERTPGLWHVEVENEEEQAAGWLWTPDVQRLIRQGYHVSFGEAWIWQEHHAVLRPWAEKLWHARCQLQDNPLAVRLLKMCYTQGLGWLNMREERTQNDKDDLHRPDWYELVKSHARLVLEMRIMRIEKSTGLRCVWANVDEIGFLSDEPEPRLAVPGLLVGDTLSGFKIKYGRPIAMTEEIRATFTTGSWNDVQKALLKAGKHG